MPTPPCCPPPPDPQSLVHASHNTVGAEHESTQKYMGALTSQGMLKSSDIWTQQRGRRVGGHTQQQQQRGGGGQPSGKASPAQPPAVRPGVPTLPRLVAPPPAVLQVGAWRGCRVVQRAACRVQGAGCRVRGGYRLQGTGCMIQGTGLPNPESALNSES